MVWDAKNSQGNEIGKIKYEIVEYTRGKVLNLGAGPFKSFPHWIDIDDKSEYSRLPWKPNLSMDCTDLSLIASKSCDAVVSSHLLEHLDNPESALKEWWRVIRVDGYLVLYLPHKLFYPNMGQPGSNPDHKHDFLPEDIIRFMQAVGTGWDLMVNEDRNERAEYSFLQVFKRRSDKEQSYPCRSKKTQKKAAVVRYGGIGDCIQASSVLPGLKKQGYHVTFHTTPTGYEFIKHDPNVDEWHIQDKDQVPNPELRDYWAVQKTKYDKWVNLTEIVEATLLPVPEYATFFWPTKARHKLMDVNYLELMHDVAEVPYDYRPRFFPSGQEAAWARGQKEDIGKCILWTISGSSVHKIWPYMDEMIARIMLEWPDWKVVLVGDELCKVVIEAPWENEPRVVRRSGIWSVREALAFAQAADMVLGPETGIMNAVSFLPMPKLIWLSHSSPENLTRDWVNTTALTPKDCPCYPCHQLHTEGFEHCSRDEETGVAACQARISLEDAWEALCKLRGVSHLEKRILWPGTQMQITL